jgi:hypothetical protein
LAHTSPSPKLFDLWAPFAQLFFHDAWPPPTPEDSRKKAAKKASSEAAPTNFHEPLSKMARCNSVLFAIWLFFDDGNQKGAQSNGASLVSPETFLHRLLAFFVPELPPRPPERPILPLPPPPSLFSASTPDDGLQIKKKPGDGRWRTVCSQIIEGLKFFFPTELVD